MLQEGQSIIRTGDEMITFKQKGNFDKTEKLLKKSIGADYMDVFHEYGQYGVQALAAASPVVTGRLASSWRYEIEKDNDYISLVFHNDDIEGGKNIAIMVQYGHATKNGYYIQGRDYINPAIKPIFDDLAEKCWKEVTSV